MPETDRLIRFPLSEISTLYLLGDESVLFSNKSKQLYGLDSTATVIIFRLEDGETAAEISDELGLSDEAALQVQKLGILLAGDEELTEEYHNDLTVPLKPPYISTALPQYRLLTSRFALEGSPDILETWINPFIKSLQIKKEPEADLLITIKRDNGKWQISLNGAIQDQAEQPERLLPMLYAQIRIFAFQKQQRLLTIHGAVITANSGETVVLAGCSGSGKSTLAATLLAKEYALVSDEPAVIDDAGTVLTMPLGLGVKEGSWKALLRYYPELVDLPVHLRFDDQKIRYLLSGSIKVAEPQNRYPVTHLIYPGYSQSSSAKLQSLSIVQTLNLFAEAGYHIPGLDEARVVGIINWLAGIERYSLVYSSTEEALLLLKEILHNT
jgi:hypothetical protein